MTRYKQSTDTIPCIGELLPLDTMLKTKGYIYPESLPASYPMDLSRNKLLGFSSTGYTLCRYEEGKGEPAGVTTFNLQGDTLWVDGRRVTSYTFTKDYHWVASNNSVSMCDSRLFGFVPDDHLIGRASLIWFSKDNEKPFWEGFRWKRFFRSVR